MAVSSDVRAGFIEYIITALSRSILNHLVQLDFFGVDFMFIFYIFSYNLYLIPTLLKEQTGRGSTICFIHRSTAS